MREKTEVAEKPSALRPNTFSLKESSSAGFNLDWKSWKTLNSPVGPTVLMRVWGDTGYGLYFEMQSLCCDVLHR